MTPRSRTVSVKQLPKNLDVKRGRLFLRELEGLMQVERPALVLDCSHLQEMDKQALHLLLCCLEGAIKRNGDVRLAAVTASAQLDLELAGIDRLFRIFNTVEEAENSFQRRIALRLPHAAGGRSDEQQPSANAA